MITQERVKELFNYDYKNGVLTWISKPASKANASLIGKRAGTQRKDGRRQVRVDNRMYMEHNIIFLWVYGFMPQEVDHVNLDPSDNRIKNLRECTRSQNSANRTAQNNNKLGVKGVSRRPGGSYLMQIRCNGKLIQKTYRNISDARCEYRRLATELFGGFARTE